MKQQEKVGFKNRAKGDQCCQTLQKISRGGSTFKFSVFLPTYFSWSKTMSVP